jgi:tetratricopeptide (TPR) repeat protein
VVYTMRYNDLGLGFGGKFLFLPFTEYNEWGERKSRGYISETIATLNISYNFLSNYYFYGLAVGANLKAAYRNIPAAIYPDQSALTGMIDVGILTRVNFLKFFISRSKNFSIGAAVKNLGLPALGEPLPTTATFGIAYSPLRPVVWAFDFNLPFSLNPDLFPAERWYLASGLSVSVTNFLSLQGGFQLRGDNPRVSVGSAIDLEKVSFVLNYNLDLSGRLNPADKFSVEATVHLGDGGRLALRDRIDELYLDGLEAYANGRLAKAIELWEEALALDPGFLPARENIETARRALQLQQEMDQQLKLGE